jgi:two-component system, response regulator, stage 0 sporulation protein F
MSTQRKKILYIDDEVVNLFLFKRLFEFSFDVETASNPYEALNKLEMQNDFSAVFSDMKMPGMDGVSFIKRAKEKFPLLDYYIITAFQFNAEVEQAQKEKLVKRVFGKPFDVPAIEREIKPVAEF